jgi:mono/diheme cytochrome c family protein
MTKTFAMFAAVALATAWSGAALADAKQQFAADCADCHEAKDFQGKSAADLEATLKAYTAGQKKHKGKAKLNDAQATEMAAYLVTLK